MAKQGTEGAPQSRHDAFDDEGVPAVTYEADRYWDYFNQEWRPYNENGASHWDGGDA